MPGGIFGDGQRGGVFGARVDPRLLQAALEQRAEAERQRQGQSRIAGAFDASQGMQEPSRALYEAKHRRAQEGQPVEPGFWSNLASVGPGIRGGLKAMVDPRTSPLGPAAVARLFMDPAGEVGRQVETGRQLAKPFTQFNDPRVDPVKQAADLALTAMGGSSVVPEEANSLRMGIKAYHGSPHDFERFDSSKIGTGEGAQAYGHGMYFAEAEPVAKQYRDNLAGYKFVQDALKAGKDKRPAQVAEWLYADPHMTDGHIAEALRVLDDKAPPEQIKAWVRDGKQLLATSKDAGRMYQVDIAADPEHFLDWDKPLSEQSPKVREAIEKQARSKPGAEDIVWRNPETGEDINLSQMQGMERSIAEKTLRKRGYGKIQPRWQHDMESMGPQSAAFGEDRVAQSQALKEAGIPGIKYLDQGSRGKPQWTVDGEPLNWVDASVLNDYRVKGAASLEKAIGEARDAGRDAHVTFLEGLRGKKLDDGGTRNYVVFDDKLISILKKYGLPISAAGLAALSQLHPQEAQAAQKKGR